MEGHAQDTSEQQSIKGYWRDAGLLALLLLLALGVRGWMIGHTEVLARDSIGFIRYAREMEEFGWTKVLRNNHQHPGYPVTVLAVSQGLRRVFDGPDTQVTLWTWSAQLASNLAAVLLIFPMYYLGKLLFHRAAGFGGAALFQCLPVCAHILSDGLSEPLFLLMSSSALLCAVLALRGNSPGWFALCGAFAGLAYLTRPEGLLVLAATLLVLVASQRSLAYRRSWRQVLVCGGSLTVATVLTGSPYYLTTGHLTNKPAGNEIIFIEKPDLDKLDPNRQESRLGGTRPLLASTLAVTFNPQDRGVRLLLKAVWSLVSELVKCFHYVAWVPVLLGMWWSRHSALRRPGIWVVLVLCGLMSVALCRLAIAEKYMSDRHLMLLVLCGSYACAVGIWELPCRVQAWYRHRALLDVPPALLVHTRRTAMAALVLLGAIIASGMPKALDRLHGNRAGYHAAGLWLRHNADAADVIDDEHHWSHYYAGHVFLEHKYIPRAADFSPTRFVVLGRRDREAPATANRQAAPSEEKLLAEGAQLVYYWPNQGSASEASVVVYALPRRKH